MLTNTSPVETISNVEIAQNILSKAKTAYSQKEFEKAIEFSQKAMKIFEANEEWEGFLEAAYQLIMAHRADCNFPLAMQIAEYALSLYQKKCLKLGFVIWQARLYKEKGKLLEIEGRFKEAIHAYKTVYQIMKKEQTDRNLFFYSLLYQIYPYIYSDNIPKAQQLLDSASELLNKEKDQNNAVLAEFYFQKGQLKSVLLKYKLAKDNYEKAYKLYPPKFFNRKELAYFYIGIMHGELGDREKELECYFKLEREYSFPYSKIAKQRLSGLYAYIGSVFNKIGEAKQALYYYEMALEFTKQISVNNNMIYGILVNMAYIYVMQENYSKQVESYEKALEIKRTITKEQNANDIITYANLIIAYQHVGNIELALVYIQKTLRLYKKLDVSHGLTVHVYTKIGMFWTKQQNYSKGLEFLYKALQLLKYLDKYDIGIIINLHICTAYNFHLQRKLNPALEQYQLALVALLPTYQKTDFYHLPNMKQCVFEFPSDFLIILEGKAQVFYDYALDLKKNKAHEGVKALKASLENCELAMDYLQELHKTLKVEGSKLIFVEKMLPLYELSIKVVLHLAKSLEDNSILEKAFYFHELANVLLLRSSMQENEAKLRTSIDSDLLQQEKDLKNKLETYLKKIEQEERKGLQKDETALQKWKEEHLNVLQKHQTLIEQFEKEYPQYYQLKYNLQTVSVSELQADLNENTVIISYFVGVEMGYIFAVTSDEYEVIPFEIPSNFDELIEAYLDNIHAQNLVDFTRLSHQLYFLLIQPIDYLVFDLFADETKNLVIIPNASLLYLPFETLIRHLPDSREPAFHQLDYLLHYCQIQYHYSATLYHQYLKQTAENNPTPYSIQSTNSVDFMGFAPIYTSDKEATQEVLRNLAGDYSRWTSHSEALREGTFIPLPFSEKEVQNIETLFTQKGLKGENFLYGNATKNHFKTFASKAKYLHIAAHGLTNDKYPKLSGIVFHPNDDSTEIYDSVLSMGEVYQLQLDADLVVLSSCESGIGQLAKGEGMMAMNRGFIHAGAKNVIYTLFKVLDKPSSELCEALFEEILAGKSYSEALRQAKLKLIQREDVDPKSWSGFVLLGA